MPFISIFLATESSSSVRSKAGQGEECAYLDKELNRGFSHWEQL